MSDTNHGSAKRLDSRMMRPVGGSSSREQNSGSTTRTSALLNENREERCQQDNQSGLATQGYDQPTGQGTAPPTAPEFTVHNMARQSPTTTTTSSTDSGDGARRPSGPRRVRFASFSLATTDAESIAPNVVGLGGGGDQDNHGSSHGSNYGTSPTMQSSRPQTAQRPERTRDDVLSIDDSIRHTTNIDVPVIDDLDLDILRPPRHDDGSTRGVSNRGHSEHGGLDRTAHGRQQFAGYNTLNVVNDDRNTRVLQTNTTPTIYSPAATNDRNGHGGQYNVPPASIMSMNERQYNSPGTHSAAERRTAVNTYDYRTHQTPTDSILARSSMRTQPETLDSITHRNTQVNTNSDATIADGGSGYMEERRHVALNNVGEHTIIQPFHPSNPHASLDVTGENRESPKRNNNENNDGQSMVTNLFYQPQPLNADDMIQRLARLSVSLSYISNTNVFNPGRPNADVLQPNTNGITANVVRMLDALRGLGLRLAGSTQRSADVWNEATRHPATVPPLHLLRLLVSSRGRWVSLTIRPEQGSTTVTVGHLIRTLIAREPAATPESKRKALERFEVLFNESTTWSLMSLE